MLRGRVRPKRVYALTLGQPAQPRRSYAVERARRLLGLGPMLAGGLVAASHVLQANTARPAQIN